MTFAYEENQEHPPRPISKPEVKILIDSSNPVALVKHVSDMSAFKTPETVFIETPQLPRHNPSFEGVQEI